MSAPIVSGGIALLLQGSPNLTPGQVKFARAAVERVHHEQPVAANLAGR